MKKVIFAILDGFGIREEEKGNAVKNANTKAIDKLLKEFPNSKLKASGEEVGLPKGQMGNSEGGQINLGAGRVVYQDFMRINNAIKDGSLAKNKVLDELLEQNNKSHFTALTDLGNQAFTFLVNNVRKILNRIAIYDADIDESLLEEHKKYIQGLIASNENILKEFNKLLTEVSQLDDTTTDDTLSKVLGDMTNSLKMLRGEDM